MPIAPSSPRPTPLPSANLPPRVPCSPRGVAACEREACDAGTSRPWPSASPPTPLPPAGAPIHGDAQAPAHTTALGRPVPQPCGKKEVQSQNQAQTPCEAPEAVKARAAVAQISATDAAQVQAGLSYVVSHFETPAMQAALRATVPGSEAHACLSGALIHAFGNLMEEAEEDWDDTPAEAIAIFLLDRCSWQSVCETRLFDKLQLLMHGDVAVAFMQAEARDADAARACASTAFAGVPDPAGLIENVLTKRRIQFWDSFLKVKSAEILREAIEVGDLARVHQLMAFAPDNSAETVAKIMFEEVGPGDAVLPALRAFCAEHRLGLPQTLQPAPVPVTLDYMDALMQRVLARGLLPIDMQYFWSVLQKCELSTRERLLRSELDSKTGGELTMLLLASPSAKVIQAFPQAMLAQLLQTYSERFERPLLGFGFDFAARLVEALPSEQVDALVAMNAYIVVRDLLEVGHWELLGKIVQHMSEAPRKDVIALLLAPPPPRDDQFETNTPQQVMPDSDKASDSQSSDDSDGDGDSDSDSDSDRLSTIPGNPTAEPPPVAYI